MKKLLQLFGTLTLITTVSCTTVACAKKYTFDSSVWVITDGGTISDLAFNQSAWEGASKYVVEQEDSTFANENWKSSQWRASYFEPVSQTPGDFKSAYITSSIAGAKTLVLPGFNHGNTIGWAAQIVDNVIYIDGSGQGIHENMDITKPNVKNIVGITFQAEASGFYASIAGSIFLNAHKNNYPEQLKIGTYGGMDNPQAVSNYMWGFLFGIDLFNTIINETIKYPHLSELKDGLLKVVKKINPQINMLKSVEKVQNVLNTNESWFSQSFQAGEGKMISDELLARGANLIFPVAGAQVQDTVNEIKNKNSTTKIIGVDTEQSKIYGTDMVITSALKEINLATYDALKNIYSDMCGYDTYTKKWDQTKVTSSCWINSDQTSVNHPTWTGIEPTKWIDQNLVNFIHNSDADITKNTAFDKIVNILQEAYQKGISNYGPIGANNFVTTLENTYDNQENIKEYILKAIENILL